MTDEPADSAAPLLTEAPPPATAPRTKPGRPKKDAPAAAASAEPDDDAPAETSSVRDYRTALIAWLRAEPTRNPDLAWAQKVTYRTLADLLEARKVP